MDFGILAFKNSPQIYFYHYLLQLKYNTETNYCLRTFFMKYK